MFSRTFERSVTKRVSTHNTLQHRNPQIYIQDLNGIEPAFPVFKQSKTIRALDCVVIRMIRIDSFRYDGEGKGKNFPCA
jgi:hypothetical protein